MKKIVLFIIFVLLATMSVNAQEKYAVLIVGDYAAKDSMVPPEFQWNRGVKVNARGMVELITKSNQIKSNQIKSKTVGYIAVLG